MTRGDFEQLINDALEDLPDEFKKQLDNVEFIAQAWPNAEDLEEGGAGPGRTLFGLYKGVAKTNRGNYTAVTPDIIKIFAGPMLAIHGENKEALRNQVRSTVLHEIGHHFGMNEEAIFNAQKSRNNSSG